MQTMNRLVAQIIGWANDRNLIEGSTLVKQYIKLVEEHGEFAAGLARGREDLMADALGDKMVILIIMDSQNDGSMLSELKSLCGAPDFSYDSVADTIKNSLADGGPRPGRGFLEAAINIGNLAFVLIQNDRQIYPDYLATCFGDTVAQCVDLKLDPVRVLEGVWEIIKDRKGRMVDGVFVKEGEDK